ncbi:acryloyl-CoA reductase [Paenibacillus cellulositrophicus]|uniref:acrylyl-CoA reductase family protein n=1 Tax=Paenibacillus cellulositrophicus TaxID=562959 RepID=UPI00203B8AFF|nr:acryloyl-CoA reductase [Paenibacillus cellulositrophicus]MCM2997044.1 acryloyl-CoA reductase [Paenibacillus cellulositrophicus]
MNTYQALTVDWKGEQLKPEVRGYSLDDLPEGDVTIRIAYSGVNYKDGLASIPGGHIVNSYPHIPGIDLSGTVVASSDPAFREGDEVLVTGYGLGVSHPGGFSQMTRVPAAWVVPLPPGMSAKAAMAVGTAGFTAALSIHRMEENGLAPGQGPVLVTGATGGVGSWAVAMLAQSGYDVTASSRKSAEAEYLQKLGAAECISPQELELPEGRSLHQERWAGAVDPVGGSFLPHVLRSVRYGGSVAVSGFTGGMDFAASVLPFILRGVNLLGIDSVQCPMELRRKVWGRIAAEWLPEEEMLDSVVREIALSDLSEALTQILQGRMRGRAIVNLT